MAILRFPRQDLSLYLVGSRLGKKDWLAKLEWLRHLRTVSNLIIGAAVAVVMVGTLALISGKEVVKIMIVQTILFPKEIVSLDYIFVKLAQ